MIIPQGAVDSPVRVTCRYIRSGNNDRQLLYPPPLMEREALASRVIEMGPPAASFKSPVLLEVPHFASLRDGERELIVLRSDDGETWQEHTMAYFSSWCNGNNQEGEIYEDFIATTGISAAYEELDTNRVVRISTQVFPKYFAILSRIKEEVRVIGADGGKIEISHTPHLQVYFPSGALQKRIKVALQIQKVPNTMLSLICPSTDGKLLHLSPLVALEPRRRRFHSPVQVMVPLPKKESNKIRRRIRLLCSLTGNTSKANWEDVTDATSFVIRSEDRLVIFETKVSALFWALAIDDDPKKAIKEEKQSESGKNSDPDYEDVELESEANKDVLRQASRIYDELILSPYMARILVLHRPHTPHAWCDSIRIYCVTDDKAELTFDAKQQGDTTSIATKSVKSATVGGEEWRLLVQSDELEVSATSTLRMDLSGKNIEIAEDCQIEFGYRKTLRFQPFQNNSCTLLVKPIDPDKKKYAKLEIRRSFDTKDTKKIANPLCTLDLNLDPSVDRRSESPSVTLENKSLSCDENSSISIEVSSNPKTLTSLTSHVVAWNQEEQDSECKEAENKKGGELSNPNEPSRRPGDLDLMVRLCYEEQNGNERQELKTLPEARNVDANNEAKDIDIKIESPNKDCIYENVHIVSSKVSDDEILNEETSLQNSSSKGLIKECTDEIRNSVHIEETSSLNDSHENICNNNVTKEEKNNENQQMSQNAIDDPTHLDNIENSYSPGIIKAEMIKYEEDVCSTSGLKDTSSSMLPPDDSAKEDQGKVKDVDFDFQIENKVDDNPASIQIHDENKTPFKVYENEDIIENENQSEADKLLMKDIFVKSLADSSTLEEHDGVDGIKSTLSNDDSIKSKDLDINVEENGLNLLKNDEERSSIEKQTMPNCEVSNRDSEEITDDKVYTTISEVEDALLIEDKRKSLGSERNSLLMEEKSLIDNMDSIDEAEVISKFLNSDNIVREVNNFEKTQVGYFDDSIIQGQTKIVLKDDLGFRRSLSMEKVSNVNEDKDEQQVLNCDNSSVEVLIESSTILLDNQNGVNDNDEIKEARQKDHEVSYLIPNEDILESINDGNKCKMSR